DLGLASTDLMYYAAGALDAPGAMFTASHNPAGYNGIKLCLAGAKPVGEDSGLAEIKKMAADGVPAAATKGAVSERDIVDGDAARVFLVDEKAQPVSGSLTTALLAKGILAKNPGETILHNLICSKSVPDVIRESGGTPVRTRVGHSFIKSVMAETGAVFGGEHSGHYYFRENYRADSGLIAALIVLELLSVSDQPLSELRKPFERYAASGEINTEVHDPGAVVE